MDPGRGLRQAPQALRRLDEGAHDVRDPLRDGPARLADVEGRHRAHRQLYVVLNMRIMTRMGNPALDDARRLERLQPRPPLDARLQPRAPLHLPFSPRQHDLESSARATAATRSSARSASRSASAATSAKNRGVARRAHAHPRRREPRRGDDVRGGRVPERVRQDELRDDDPARALQGDGRSGRWGTTSAGCASARTDASGRSTRRRATSASRPGRTTSRTRTR
jgi:hypothetical protein